MRSTYNKCSLVCLAAWLGLAPAFGAQSYKAALQTALRAQEPWRPSSGSAGQLSLGWYVPNKNPAIAAAKSGEQDSLTQEELTYLYQYAEQPTCKPYEAGQIYYALFLSPAASDDMKIQSCVRLSQLYLDHKRLDLGRLWTQEALSPQYAQDHKAAVARFKAQLFASQIPHIQGQQKRVAELRTLARAIGRQEGVPYNLLIVVYLGLGNNQSLSDEERAQHYHKALRLARKRGVVRLAIKAYIYLGNLGVNEADQYYTQALTLSQRYGHKDLEGAAWLGWGDMQEGAGAIKCYHKARQLALASQDAKLNIRALLRLGDCSIDNQIAYYQQAADLAAARQYTQWYGRALIRLGNAGHRRTQCYHKGIELARLCSDIKLEAEAWIGLGNMQTKESVAHFHQGLKLAIQCNNKNLKIRAYTGLGNAGVLQQLYYYQQAIALALECEDRKRPIVLLIRLANVPQQALAKRLGYYDQAIGFAKQYGYEELEAEACIGKANAQRTNDAHVFERAIDLLRGSENCRLWAQAYRGLGHTYISAITQAEWYDQEALYHAQQACYITALEYAHQGQLTKLAASIKTALNRAYQKQYKSYE